MGLDWNPGPKARAGHEEEFRQLWTKLQSKWCFRRERKRKRFEEITLSAFDTLGAPCVGLDESASEWARQRFPKRVNKSIDWERFHSQMKGFRVLDLVPPCDGIARYTNGEPGGYVEAYSFRAAFLNDCTDIIGEDLLASAYESKLPAQTEAFGAILLRRATDFSSQHSIETRRIHPSEDPDSVEFHLDVVFAAGRWCRFWGERGHWLEAYF